MTAPEQLAPPVYACAAGAVLHAHAASTLEPAVVLHTFLPPGAGEQLDGPGTRVDVHSDGAGAGTLTVRVLTDGRSLSWSLPVAPFVAALPGQPGDEGRMVLLAVVDGEPPPGFWASAVDCEALAAELQLPVADLVEALRGRLTPWLADDLEGLLHDDAHDRAVDRSPAQTLADAVLAHYRGDLDAETVTTRLVRAVDLAPEEYAVQLSELLCAALVEAVRLSSAADREALLAQTGPFETEALRLLTDLPPVVERTPYGDRVQVVLSFLLDGGDREETVRAAVSVVARLARSALGAGLPDDEVLRRLDMLDDAGLARLSRLWVRLAAAVDEPAGDDPSLAASLAPRVVAEGSPGATWLAATALVLAGAAVEVAGRHADRLADPLGAVRRLVDRVERGDELDAAGAADALAACLVLARFARVRGGVGPGTWLRAPAAAAAAAVTAELLEGLDRETAVDLLAALLEDDVEGPDLLDGFICATAQVLAEVDPEPDQALRPAQVAALLQDVPGGPRGARWLLTACLREAPHHDPAAADLTALLPAESVDPDRAAEKAGTTGVLRAGLVSLEALVRAFGEEAHVSRAEVLGAVLPTALVEHDLLRRPA
ncbi:MAG TPA: hypothetical protein VNU66_02360 [Mycobacteriales bacterium]|nr:hypothetical protein [Mycobacteriales bacterium]